MSSSSDIKLNDVVSIRGRQLLIDFELSNVQDFDGPRLIERFKIYPPELAVKFDEDEHSNPYSIFHDT